MRHIFLPLCLLLGVQIPPSTWTRKTSNPDVHDTKLNAHTALSLALRVSKRRRKNSNPKTATALSLALRVSETKDEEELQP